MASAASSSDALDPSRPEKFDLREWCGAELSKWSDCRYLLGCNPEAEVDVSVTYDGNLRGTVDEHETIRMPFAKYLGMLVTDDDGDGVWQRRPSRLRYHLAQCPLANLPDLQRDAWPPPPMVPATHVRDHVCDAAVNDGKPLAVPACAGRQRRRCTREAGGEGLPRCIGLGGGGGSPSGSHSSKRCRAHKVAHPGRSRNRTRRTHTEALAVAGGWPRHRCRRTALAGGRERSSVRARRRARSPSDARGSSTTGQNNRARRRR